jgi:hypothetical protein
MGRPHPFPAERAKAGKTGAFEAANGPGPLRVGVVASPWPPSMALTDAKGAASVKFQIFEMK